MKQKIIWQYFENNFKVSVAWLQSVQEQVQYNIWGSLWTDSTIAKVGELTSDGSIIDIHLKNNLFILALTVEIIYIYLRNQLSSNRSFSPTHEKSKPISLQELYLLPPFSHSFKLFLLYINLHLCVIALNVTFIL